MASVVKLNLYLRWLVRGSFELLLAVHGKLPYEEVGVQVHGAVSTIKVSMTTIRAVKNNLNIRMVGYFKVLKVIYFFKFRATLNFRKFKTCTSLN